MEKKREGVKRARPAERMRKSGTRKCEEHIRLRKSLSQDEKTPSRGFPGLSGWPIAPPSSRV